MFLGYDDFKKYIQRNLKRGQAVAEDRYIFQRYSNGEISFEKLIKLFTLSNQLDRGKEIEEKHMVQWLNELGYRKAPVYED